MMASNSSANWGSLPTLNVGDRWGFRPCLCQIRRTLFSLSSAALAMPRVLQCVALVVFYCVFFRTTSWILAGVIVEGLPGRGASFSRAANPPSRNRLPAGCLLRHDFQFGGNLLILHSTRSQQDNPRSLRGAWEVEVAAKHESAGT